MTKLSKTALITGITGQDGTYLAELLLNLRDGIARACADFLSQAAE